MNFIEYEYFFHIMCNVIPRIHSSYSSHINNSQIHAHERSLREGKVVSIISRDFWGYLHVFFNFFRSNYVCLFLMDPI